MFGLTELATAVVRQCGFHSQRAQTSTTAAASLSL